MRTLIPKGKEVPVAIVLLALYGCVLFFNPDMEWACWAASMAMGCLYFEAIPSMKQILTGETLSALSIASAIGLVIWAALLAFWFNKK